MYCSFTFENFTIKKNKVFINIFPSIKKELTVMLVAKRSASDAPGGEA